ADRDVAGAADADAGAVEAFLLGHHHFLHEVDRTVASRLLADQGTTPLQALAGQHAGLVADIHAPVLAEEITDLTSIDADVAGWDVRVLTDVAVQLGHEGLAEAHDLVIGAPLRIEVGATLAATDWQAGQGVLKDLLETEELDDAQVHGRVETQTALV